jgi:serine/threonine protein kinase
MGGCCSGNKDPKGGNSSHKTELAHHDGAFAALAYEKKNPRIKEGSAKAHYTFASPIPGLYDTFHGENSKTKQHVAITQIVYSHDMSRSQAAALSAIMKYKPNEKAEKSQAAVHEVYFEGSTLTLISEVRTAMTASKAVAARDEKVAYDEECVAAVFHDVAQAVNDLHRHKLLQANLSFEGLLAEITDKNVISVQIPTFSLHALAEPSKPVHHKGAYPPEILLEGKAPTEQTDAWNLGVLLHVMLVGYPPLMEGEADAKKQMEDMKGGAAFPIAEHYWSAVSEDARYLVEDLLKIDPAKRMTVSQVLDAPWIEGRVAGSVDLTETKRKFADSILG